MKNDKEIKGLIKKKVSGKYPAGNNLYLRISKELTTSWLVRYTINGKRKEITIGNYPDVSLHKAGLRAIEIKVDAKNGIDPQSSDQPDVFFANIDELAKEWLKDKGKKISSLHIYERRYKNDISPEIGNLKVGSVTAIHVKNLVGKVAVPGRMTVANDVLQDCKDLFNYAIKLGLLTVNPAAAFRYDDAGGIEKSRDRNLPLAELRDVFAAMRKHMIHFTRDNYLNAAMLLVLAVRKNELSVACLNEFDLDSGVWTLPDERIAMMEKTNKKRPVHIPLEPEVVEWVTELKYRAGGSEYLFPARRASKRFDHIGPDTLNAAIYNMFKKGLFPESVKHFTVHDLRRTARTIMSREDVNPWVAERCLGHELPGTEGIYNRDDYFDNRREAQRKLLDVCVDLINVDGGF